MDDKQWSLSGANNFESLDKLLDAGKGIVRKGWGGRRVEVGGEGGKHYSLVQIWDKVENAKGLTSDQRAKLFEKVVRLDKQASEALAKATAWQEYATVWRRGYSFARISDRASFNHMKALLEGIPDGDVDTRVKILEKFQDNKDKFTEVAPHHIIESFCEGVGRLPKDQRAEALANTALLSEISEKYTALKGQLGKKNFAVLSMFWDGVRGLPPKQQAEGLENIKLLLANSRILYHFEYITHLEDEKNSGEYSRIARANWRIRELEFEVSLIAQMPKALLADLPKEKLNDFLIQITKVDKEFIQEVVKYKKDIEPKLWPTFLEYAASFWSASRGYDTNPVPALKEIVNHFKDKSNLPQILEFLREIPTPQWEDVPPILEDIFKDIPADNQAIFKEIKKLKSDQQLVILIGIANMQFPKTPEDIISLLQVFKDVPKVELIKVALSLDALLQREGCTAEEKRALFDKCTTTPAGKRDMLLEGIAAAIKDIPNSTDRVKAIDAFAKKPA